MPQGWHGPSCHGTDTVRPGTTPADQPRDRGRMGPERRRPLPREDADAGHAPALKRLLVARAVPSRGMCAPARVWPGSSTTVRQAFTHRQMRLQPSSSGHGSRVSCVARLTKGNRAARSMI